MHKCKDCVYYLNEWYDFDPDREDCLYREWNQYNREIIFTGKLEMNKDGTCPYFKPKKITFQHTPLAEIQTNSYFWFGMIIAILFCLIHLILFFK